MYVYMYINFHVYPQLMDYKVKWSESQTELQQQLKGAKKVSESGTCAQCGGAFEHNCLSTSHRKCVRQF